MILLKYFFVVSTILVFVGCGGSQSDSAEVRPPLASCPDSCTPERLSLKESEPIRLGVGESRMISLYMLCSDDENGTMGEENIARCATYEVTDETVVYVDRESLFHARKIGLTDVNVSYKALSETIVAEVVPAYVSQMRIDPPEKIVRKDKLHTLQAVGIKTDGTQTVLTATWRSEDTTCVGVDERRGVIVGKKPCATRIYASIVNRLGVKVEGSALIKVTLDTNNP